jgi:YfiH family protein
MTFLQSELLKKVPGLVHGFGTLECEVPDLGARVWEGAKPLWKQVHGVAVARVTAPGQSCGDVDGLFALEKGLPVGVVTADCVPVLMARRTGGAVAAIHAGWRGTRAHILRETWARLQACGENSADWVAAIGPSIGPCCYEVSEELAGDFVQEFSAFSTGVVSPKHRFLDLPAINAEELRTLGFATIDILRECTRCSNDAHGNFKFHSYRREGGGSRQCSIAVAF